MDTSSTSHGAEETKILIPEMVRTTTERLEADFSRIGTKIHRFPRGLRWIGGQGDRYIIPGFVALGPYHHGLPHLQEVEEVKHAAAHYFCAQSGHSVEAVYGKILSISGEARSCYADGDDAVARFSDADFAAMMFLDGCFLLHYIVENKEPALLFNRMILSTGPCMLRDIFLLENQLPWLVLEALMEFKTIDVAKIISDMAESFDIGTCSKTGSFVYDNNYRLPHLLGLLRHYQISSMPTQDLGYDLTSVQMASNAIELAEMGVMLTASDKPWFADMSIQNSGPFFAKLSLTPLFLNDFTACWLVNMAALEACTSAAFPCDGYTICSYLSLLAMLMDKEEDVHELRAKHILRSFFSNQELLDFFKGLARHLRLGYRYFVLVQKIHEYKQDRPIRVALHKFVYNNFRIIVAVLSIASVLVGIFRTLLSLKQHQP